MDNNFNLSDLNRQMISLNNDFQLYQSSNPVASDKVNSINFQDVQEQNPIETTQIKRPSRSGEHRNEINDKINALNLTPVIPQNVSRNPPNMMPTMPQFIQTRNNGNYVNESQRWEPHQNHVTQYYNQNFDSLNKPVQSKPLQQIPNINIQNQRQQQPQHQHQQPQQFNQTNFGMPDQGHANKYSTHGGGVNLLNVTNMYALNGMNNQQQQMMGNVMGNGGISNNSNEEKRIDYRQNMNNKLDGLIFDNPISVPPNPILLQNQQQTEYKDKRMVIQDNAKNTYRQEANERMLQYSPLSRAAYVPTNIASMSVNDFYPTINSNDIYQYQQGSEYEPSSKEMLSSRMSEYAPLARTIQLNDNNSNQQNSGLKPIPTLQKTTGWNSPDINHNMPNMIYNNYPIMSNKM
jgi:hypothetical protein